MMDTTAAGLLQAARNTVIDPRAGARSLLGLGLAMRARWLAFGIVVSASSVLTVVALYFSPSVNSADMEQVLARPIPLAIVQGVVLWIFAQLMARVGQFAGGKGNFADALLLLTWMQVIMLLVQLAQIAVEIVLPPLTDLFGLLGLALMFWLVTHFVAELHGFTSLGKVFLAILATLLTAGFAVSVLLVTVVGLG